MLTRHARPLAIVALCLALAAAMWPGVAGAQTVAADVAYQEADRGAVTLIDVRSPAEWRDTGVPRHARTVTIHNPGGADAFIREVLTAVDGDRARPIALICAAGGRSRAALELLAGNGFTHLQNVAEGVLGNDELPGWRNRGLPLEPCAGC